MPSRFLETFGLSALESLSAGVPVVAFDKGGLSQFLVSSGLEVEDSPDDAVRSANLTEKLEALSEASDGLSHEWKIASFRRAKEYSAEAFSETLSRLLPKTAKKILLVTDFSGDLGGIETYVAKLGKRLSLMGYEVRTVSKTVSEWGTLRRIFTTLAAFANPVAAIGLRRAVRGFDPDVVWCHSVLRRFGPVGILPLRPRIPKDRKSANTPDAFFAMTYHDFGYFAPSAGAVRFESDVPEPGFSAFVSKAPGPFSKLAAMLKYAKLSLLFRRLRRFDLHVVPSSFMERFVRSRVGKDARIETLPHFTD